MKVIDSHSELTAHPAQLVFSRWADPARWPDWDTEVQEVNFYGPAELGAHGRMRPASGPATKFTITALEQDRVFTNASSLPGATLIFEHLVTQTDRGTEIQVSVGVDGFLSSLWQRILGKTLGNAARSSVTGLLDHLDAA